MVQHLVRLDLCLSDNPLGRAMCNFIMWLHVNPPSTRGFGEPLPDDLQVDVRVVDLDTRQGHHSTRNQLGMHKFVNFFPTAELQQ